MYFISHQTMYTSLHQKHSKSIQRRNSFIWAALPSPPFFHLIHPTPHSPIPIPSFFLPFSSSHIYYTFIHLPITFSPEPLPSPLSYSSLPFYLTL